MVDEAAVLVLNHQAGANTHQSELVLYAVFMIRDVFPSRIMIYIHSGSPISDNGSLIPDLESRIQKQQKREGGRILLFYIFFVATYSTKLFLNR